MSSSCPGRAAKEALVRQLRDYLHQVCHELGLPTRIVPHQFRHTYASEMLRAGVGLPALMKLLGHVDPDMTMRYLDVTLTDLQREFQLARSKPRHLTPAAQDSSGSASNWPRRRHRCAVRCPTCAGDVPPHAAKRRHAHLPRPALQPTHKNHRRSKKAQHRLRSGRDWPVKRVIREQSGLRLGFHRCPCLQSSCT